MLVGPRIYVSELCPGTMTPRQPWALPDQVA